MASDYFSLGDVFLAWTPTGIDYGAAHFVTKHTNIGGHRTFDLMGDNPDDIVVTGKLANSTRFTDRDAIKAMVGTQQTLTWGDDSLDVIVLKAPYKQNYACIDFTITCAVLVSTTTPTTTPAASAANSVSQAQTAAAGDTVTPALPTTVQSPLTASASILNNSSLDPSTAIPSLQQALTAATGIVSQADTTIGGFDVGAVGGSMSVPVFIGGVQNYSAALNTRVLASHVVGLATQAINTITNGF